MLICLQDEGEQGKTSMAKAFAKIINCLNPNDTVPCDVCVSCTKTNLKQNTDIIESKMLLQTMA